MKNTNKKVGILTWYNHGNYGSALQAYALMVYLNQNKVDADIIPYVPQWERILLNDSFIKNIKREIKKILGVIGELLPIKKNKYFDKMFYFRHKYLKLKGVCTEHNISKYVEGYTTLVCGSDQIWNPTFIDEVFLINFKHKNVRKVSYASSLGVKIMPKEFTELYKSLLLSFDSISVREDSGREILKSIGVESEVHVDPTMLLDANYYRKISKKIYNVNKKYIFCYFLKTGNKNYKESIKEYAKKNDLPVIGISFDEADYNWMVNFSSATPNEWLWLIDHAYILMTNSYHATIFSLLFHTNFCTFVRFSNDDRTNQNSRIEQLNTYFAIDEYIIDGPIINSFKYDFYYFERKLKELKLQSEKYLYHNIISTN